MTDKTKCSYHIFSGARGDIAGHPCPNRGVVEVDGKLFCRIHDPKVIAARREARSKKYKVEQAKQITALRRERAAYNALDVKSPKAKARIEELEETLRYALRCVQYCRKSHPDSQKGDGVSAETVIEEVLSRA